MQIRETELAFTVFAFALLAGGGLAGGPLTGQALPPASTFRRHRHPPSDGTIMTRDGATTTTAGPNEAGKGGADFDL
jgi:hypothetical protein